MRNIFYVTAIIAVLSQPLWAQPTSDEISEAEFASQSRLARVYEETRDYNNALRIYEGLHKVRPNAPEISDGLYRSYFLLKRYPEAEAIVRHRLATEGESFSLLLNLARTLAKQSKKTEALEAFEMAHAIDPELHPYSKAMNISQLMVESAFTEEALAYLHRVRNESDQDHLITAEIGSLLFKMGRYEEGTKEYLSVLDANENQLSFVQSRLAVITQDSLVRKKVVTTIASGIDVTKATIPQLRLLSWCYGEMKDHRRSYEVMLKLDEKGTSTGQSSSGYELYHFAERIRNEGALEVAVMAYEEAIKRLQRSAGADPRREYFMGQAELGSLKTTAQFMLTKNPPASKQELNDLIARFTSYAASKKQNDLALDALLRAGSIAFDHLFDPMAARSIYEKALARTGGYSEKMRDILFALEEVSLADGDLVSAREHLKKIRAALSLRNRPEDGETHKRIIYEMARIDYYAGELDSAAIKLAIVAGDPQSDYANDAIGLGNLIAENRTPGDAALKIFAHSELAAFGRKYDEAMGGYRTIIETMPKDGISDDAVLRAADLLVRQSKPNDALALLDSMQERTTRSPLADKAGLLAAEIVETVIGDSARAQKMYEEFLERYESSPLCTEARKRARRLRGDVF